MYSLDDFPFKYSSLPSPEVERPAKFFNTLPYRVRTIEDDCGSTIDRVVAEWKAITGKGVPDAVGGHASDLIRYVIPECPIEFAAPVTRFIYILLLWDGMLPCTREDLANYAQTPRISLILYRSVRCCVNVLL
jgi:hypothetical protein